MLVTLEINLVIDDSIYGISFLRFDRENDE